MRKSLLNACCLQLAILCLICVFYYNADIYSFETKATLEIAFLLVVVESISLHTYFHQTIKNIDNLFIALFFFFLGSRFLFDLCSDEYNVCYFDFFYNRFVSVNIINRAILNLIVALCSYNIGSLLWRFHKNNSSNTQLNLIRPLQPILSNRVTYALLCMGFIAKAYYAYQVFGAILAHGYLAFFLGEIEIYRNMLMWFCESFYEIAIFIIISRNSKLKFVEILAIVVYIVLSMGTGQRGFAMLTIVFILFYSYKLGRIKLRLPYIIFSIFLLSIVAILVGNIRSGNAFVLDDVFSVFKDFIYGQAVSITVLVATIDYDSQIHLTFWDLFAHIRYLLTYYWEKITFQSPLPIDLTTQAEEYKWYGQYISSIVNEKMFYNGFGLGSSYVAQFYAVGKEFFQLIGGIFVGYVAGFLYYCLKSENFLKRFWAFHALTIFIFIPRANLFEFISMQWMTYMVSAVLYCFILCKLKKTSTYAEGRFDKN